MGAQSSTEIANLALSKLGAKRIQDIGDDSSKGAREANLQYGPALRAMLRRHRWNFALKRAQLTELADSPAFGYNNQFQLPTDFIRLAQVNQEEVWETSKADWFEVEGGDTGRVILINAAECYIRYVWENTNTQQFDDLFVQAFALQLAALCARKVTGSDSKEHAIQQELEEFMLPMTQQVNAAEAHSGSNPPIIEALAGSHLVRSRGQVSSEDLPLGPDETVYTDYPA